MQVHIKCTLDPM